MTFKLLPKDSTRRDAELERELIKHEAAIGGQLFGPVPEGHKRQFFCLDAHTWIWHEEWTDAQGVHQVTTRYDVRPNGVLKSQNGQNQQWLSRSEAKNLYRAAGLYLKKVTDSYHQKYLAT